MFICNKAPGPQPVVLLLLTLREKPYFPGLGISKKAKKKTCKYHLSINFLAEKKTVFPFTEKFKIITSQ